MTDASTNAGAPREDLDARLERLRAATDPVRPRADFGDRVAAAIAREGGAAWMGDVARAARWLLPAAIVTIAVGVGWAVQSQRAWRAAASATTEAEAADEW